MNWRRAICWIRRRHDPRIIGDETPIRSMFGMPLFVLGVCIRCGVVLELNHEAAQKAQRMETK